MMNLNTDKQLGYMNTVSNEVVTAISYTIRQNSFNTMNIKIEVVDQSSGHLGTLQYLACIQRGLASCRIAQSSKIISFIGDNQLSTADITLAIDGSSLLVKVNGIDPITLDWCVQLENDVLTAL